MAIITCIALFSYYKVSEMGVELDNLLRENRSFKEQVDYAKRTVDASRTHPYDASMPLVKAGPLGTVKMRRLSPHLQRNDEAANLELDRVLRGVVKNDELIVGVANNKYPTGILKVWSTSIERAGVTNYLLVALDDEVAEFCIANKVPFYRRNATMPQPHAEKHALLRDFLVAGYSVLLSDVDVVFLQNPFDFLHRDCDVEAMSDGYDDDTAYGFDDVKVDASLGWSRGVHTNRIWDLNSGLFYVQPTVAALEFVDRVTARLASNAHVWDQGVFNMELFRPSAPRYEGLHASVRVMDYLRFVNSRVLFGILRKSARSRAYKPVAVHVNYHPDKLERMVAIVDYFVNEDGAKYWALADFYTLPPFD